MIKGASGATDSQILQKNYVYLFMYMDISEYVPREREGKKREDKTNVYIVIIWRIC